MSTPAGFAAIVGEVCEKQFGSGCPFAASERIVTPPAVNPACSDDDVHALAAALFAPFHKLADEMIHDGDDYVLDYGHHLLALLENTRGDRA